MSLHEELPDPVAFAIVLEAVEVVGLDITDTITNPYLSEESQAALNFASQTRSEEAQAMAQHNAQMNRREADGALLPPMFKSGPDELWLRNKAGGE
jgi:hypothetical protein